MLQIQLSQRSEYCAPPELVRPLLPLLFVPSLLRRLSSLRESFIESPVSCLSYLDQIKLAPRDAAQSFAQRFIGAHRVDLIQSVQIRLGRELANQSANAIVFDEFVQIADSRIANDRQPTRQILGNLCRRRRLFGVARFDKRDSNVSGF